MAKKQTQTKTVTEQTILSAIDRIYIAARGSRLELSKLELEREAIDFLTSKLSITPLQSLLLSVMINYSENMYDSMSDIARYLACSRIRMLSFRQDFEALAARKFIYYNSSRKEFAIVAEALEAFCHNKCYEPEPLTGLNVEQFFAAVAKVCEDFVGDRLDGAQMRSALWELYLGNKQLSFVQQLDKTGTSQLEKQFFIYTCSQLVNKGDALICEFDVQAFFSGQNRNVYIRFYESLIDGQSPLVREQLIVPACISGYSSRESFELSPMVRRNFLKGLVQEVVNKSANRNLKPYDSIKLKPMFYNAEEQQSIDRLVQLLDKENFNKVTSTLATQGFRQGFTCIFYGAPGTGKTESVLQIARKTGRDIMQVNISQMKSKWVGESEKNIKALFDSYREAVRSCQVAPILFFNEADAIFGSRLDNVSSSVEKMDNAIQNIILEEMEKMEGVLIATTNLVGNMDKAFERRFLYKVEFKTPSAQARSSIWQSMLPQLSAEDADILASKYDLSGGEIENVARRYAVEQIINGQQATLELLCQMCDNERLSNNKANKIGF